MTTKTESLKFVLSKNHSHFFIKNLALYEAVGSLRGLKVKHRLDLQDELDCDNLSLAQISHIEQKYLKT